MAGGPPIRSLVQSSSGLRSEALFSGAGGAALPEALPSPQKANRPSRYLVDVVQLKVLEQQQQHSRDGLNDDLFVAVHIHAQLHALQHCSAKTRVPGERPAHSTSFLRVPRGDGLQNPLAKSHNPQTSQGSALGSISQATQLGTASSLQYILSPFLCFSSKIELLYQTFPKLWPLY